MWPWLILAAGSLLVQSYFRDDDAKARLPRGATLYPTFRDLMEKSILPWQSYKPSGDRIDGSAGAGVKPCRWFERDGRVWCVNSDTRMAPLYEAYAWSEKNDWADPFVVGGGKGKRRTLILRPEMRWAGPKQMYIYEC